jgi:hypothetical protein
LHKNWLIARTYFGQTLLRGSDGASTHAQGFMKLFKKISVIILVAIVAGVTAAIASNTYFHSDSFGASAWRARMTEALQRDGEVAAGDLVSFEWDRVYFIGAYDLYEDKIPIEIWGHVNGLAWDTNKGYWTVIYRRIGKPPFIVKMRSTEWRAMGWRAISKDAKLRLIMPGKYESCMDFRVRCIALVCSDPTCLRLD